MIKFLASTTEPRMHRFFSRVDIVWMGFLKQLTLNGYKNRRRYQLRVR